MQIFLAIFLTLFSSPLLAADSHFAPMGDVMVTEMPLKRAKLGLNLYPVNFPLSGLSKEAQAFFNQGVSALHGFWTLEAERNFREVILLAPKNPIGPAFAAYAQQVFSSGDRARGALYATDARRLLREKGTVLTESEVLWVEAILALYDKRISTEKERQDKHLSLLDDVLNSASKDQLDLTIETKAFLALGIWNYQYQSTKNKTSVEAKALREKADNLISQVFNKSAEHPANHYKIHLWNDQENEVMAWDSSLRGGKSSPACAHQWHMQSHISFPLGYYRTSAYNFEAAARVDNRYLHEHKLPGNVIHNYAHNLDFYLSALDGSGALDRIEPLYKNILGMPRFIESPIGYFDPAEATLATYLGILENYDLWKTGYSLNAQQSFKGFFEREDDDSYNRAKLFRFVSLASFENADMKGAAVSQDHLGKLRSRVKKAEVRDRVLKIEKDLALWKTIYSSKERGTIPTNVFSSLRDLGVTPLRRVALASFELNDDLDLALDYAKEAYKSNDRHVLNSAVYTYLLAKNGQKKEALKFWELTKKLIHVPAKQDLISLDKPYSVKGAFAFLEKIHASLSPESDQKEFYAVSSVGRQHTLSSWSKSHENFTPGDLGPLYYKAPVALIGEKHKAFWATLKGNLLPPMKKILEEGVDQYGPWTLVVFQQSLSCESCLEEGQKLAQKWAEKFTDAKVQVLMVYPSKEFKLDHEKEKFISVLFDPSHILYKNFGAYDEFLTTPTHGVFLIGPGNKIRWSRRGEHAFKNWSELLRETTRLRDIKFFEGEE